MIGWGCHEHFGGPHAEENALRCADAWEEEKEEPIPGQVDEIFVSLEPCSSEGPHKKRPSCVTALLQAGVKRVVVGAVDPNPEHAGSGLRKLRQAGIEVIDQSAVFQSRFEEQNPAFLVNLQNLHRPWVIAKWAATLDGKTAASGGASQWITGPEARAETHLLRSYSQGILVGSKTLAFDDPELTARPGGKDLESQPLRILLGGSSVTAHPARRVMQAHGPRLWVLGKGDKIAAEVRADRTGKVLEVHRSSAHQLDLAELLTHLKEHFGISRLWVEGGAVLHGALLDCMAVDAVVRYEAPLLLGGPRGSFLGAGAEIPAKSARLIEEERADLGGDLRRAFLLVPA